MPTSTPDRIARRPGLSLRMLSLLAVMVAGAVIFAQTLFAPAAAVAGQALVAHAWERTAATGQPTEPWPWAGFTPSAQLTFPAQNASLITLAGESPGGRPFGALHPASMQPGEAGVALFTAHSPSHAAMLTRIKPGDPMLVATPSGERIFRVTGSKPSALAPEVTAGGEERARIVIVAHLPASDDNQGIDRYVVEAVLEEPLPPES